MALTQISFEEESGFVRQGSRETVMLKGRRREAV